MMARMGISLNFFYNTTLEQRLVKAIISENLTKNLLEAYTKLDSNVVNAHYEHSDDAGVCFRETFLTLAAKHSNLEVFLGIFQHPKVDPNIPNNEGNTALHIAAGLGRTDIVVALLRDHRTDVSLKNANGASARDLSRKYLSCPELEEMIIQETIQNKRGFTRKRLSSASAFPRISY
jgi:hypothetical protein